MFSLPVVAIKRQFTSKRFGYHGSKSILVPKNDTFMTFIYMSKYDLKCLRVPCMCSMYVFCLCILSMCSIYVFYLCKQLRKANSFRKQTASESKQRQKVNSFRKQTASQSKQLHKANSFTNLSQSEQLQKANCFRKGIRNQYSIFLDRLKS